MSNNYKVCGYDKDNDTYETIDTYDNKEDAVQKLAAITAAHLLKPIKRKSNGELFDWFNIFENESDIIATGFTEIRGVRIAKIMLDP